VKTSYEMSAQQDGEVMRIALSKESIDEIATAVVKKFIDHKDKDILQLKVRVGVLTEQVKELEWKLGTN